MDGTVTTTSIDRTKIVFWHRELPPLAASVVDEHVVEATSARFRDTPSSR